MFFFNKKYKLKDTDFLNGLTDYHCHILFDVDDGIKNIEDSLEVLDFYESVGIRRLVLTPHVMEDVSVEWDERKEKFRNLCQSYNGSMEIKLSAEHMLDEGLIHEIDMGLHPLFDNNVLVETSFISAPRDMDEMIYKVKLAGFTPIIAHPERYLYMDSHNYDTLIDNGCKLQLNIPSLAGVYGERVKDRALQLLLMERYFLIGTDLHNLNSFKRCLDKISLKKKEMNALLELKERLGEIRW